MHDRIGEIDVAIVLGSGLSDVLGERAVFDRIPYGEIGIPLAPLEGHAGNALVGRWHGKRVLAYAGRIHAYQGFDARDITRSITIAADCGAKTVLLTNAAGSLNENIRPGDLMLITDHINLSGLNPLVGSGLANPFINMTDAYSKRLRDVARLIDDDLVEGVYACLLGPTYETTAEANFLRTIGADAVGMSTVLETIAARARKLEVFGVSLITNMVAAPETSHAEVTEAARSAGRRLADLIEELVQRV
ncbi:MAG TPA: purine-nucleoside phosphorylase [Candidatus Baltobacteraceae bacterium]|jgi:purine-nucleoside phosphorylase|nr:purine-nucleoside phosphorylase [Candidatus Baltobacteraceae bacterium]